MLLHARPPIFTSKYLRFFTSYMFLTRIETGNVTKRNISVNDCSSLFHENNVSANNKKTKGLSEPHVISRYHRNQKWTFHLRRTTNLSHKSNQKTTPWVSFREPPEAPRTFPRPSQHPSISPGPSGAPLGTSRNPQGPTIHKKTKTNNRKIWRSYYS